MPICIREIAAFHKVDQTRKLATGSIPWTPAYILFQTLGVSVCLQQETRDATSHLRSHLAERVERPSITHILGCRSYCTKSSMEDLSDLTSSTK